MTTPYKYVELEDLPNHIDADLPLMFDTETDGFYNEIVLAQFYQKGWDRVLMLRNPDPNELADLINNYHLIMQNSAYDISTIQKQTGTRWVPNNFDDTFLLARLYFYKEASFSLDKIMEYTLGYDPYKRESIDKKVMQKTKWKTDAELTQEQEEYAAIDVYYLPEVWEKVKGHLNDTNYKLDKITVKNCMDFQNNGLPVIESKRVAMAMADKALTDEMALPINVNSWQQVREYIGEDESDDIAMARFAIEGNEKAGKVRKCKKHIKRYSTLTKKFKSENNRIYGKFSPSTRSGRLSCKDQNLQQLDRTTKGLFGYEECDGRVIIYSDFSQIQLRIAACIAPDHRMADLYRTGADIHTYTKDAIAWLANNSKGRQIAKTCNFNLLFGGSANMLGNILLKQADILLPQDTLYRLKSNWLELWVGINDWQQRGIDDWNHGVAWSTPIGRRYMGKMMTDHLNIAVQGSEADIAKLALHKIMKKIKLIQGVEVNDMIHDSYILSSPNDSNIYEEVSYIIAEAMQTSWNEVSNHFEIKDLPLPVDVAVGYNWGDIEDDDVANIYDYHID